MTNKQYKIQELHDKKQNAINSANNHEIAYILSNCAAAISATFILINAINEKPNVAGAAALISLIFITISGMVKQDAKAYKNIAHKCQKKINRLTRQR